MEVKVWDSREVLQVLRCSCRAWLCSSATHRQGVLLCENEPCAKGSLIEHLAMTRLCCCQDEAVVTFAVSLFRALQSQFDFMLRHSDRWKVAHESCNGGQAALTGFSGHRN